MVSRSTSDWPKVSTRSWKVPITVNCRPYSLITWFERGAAAAVHALRQVVGEQRDLLAHGHVARIQKPAGTDHDVAHRGVILVGAD